MLNIGSTAGLPAKIDGINTSLFLVFNTKRDVLYLYFVAICTFNTATEESERFVTIFGRKVMLVHWKYSRSRGG